MKGNTAWLTVGVAIRVLFAVMFLCVISTQVSAQTVVGGRQYVSFTRGDDSSLWIIGTDGEGLKNVIPKLRNTHEFDQLWLSPTKIVYSREDNLWLLDIQSPKKTRQITFDGKPLNEYFVIIDTNGQKARTHLICKPIAFNGSRRELYYYLSKDSDDRDLIRYRVLDLNTMKARDLHIPDRWNDYNIEANGDWMFGTQGVMPSGLVALNIRTGMEIGLTEADGNWGDDQAQLSPDGKLLAFTRDMEIYIFDLQTSEARRLAGKGQSPIWSPDGKLIAFQHDIHPTGDPQIYQYNEIYVTDLAGNKQTLVSGKDYGKIAPMVALMGWTGKGEVIWYHSYTSAPGPHAWNRTDLKVIDPHTKHKRILLRGVSDAAIWRHPGELPQVNLKRYQNTNEGGKDK